MFATAVNCGAPSQLVHVDINLIDQEIVLASETVFNKAVNIKSLRGLVFLYVDFIFNTRIYFKFTH